MDLNIEMNISTLNETVWLMNRLTLPPPAPAVVTLIPTEFMKSCKSTMEILHTNDMRMKWLKRKVFCNFFLVLK